MKTRNVISDMISDTTTANAAALRLRLGKEKHGNRNRP